MNTHNEPITNSEDVIDSRDVIARIETLESEQETLKGDWDGSSLLDAPAEFLEWEKEYGEELDSLRALAEEAEGYASDWQYGEALIRDSYFEDYARDLADDIGAINKDATWPCNCIDWEQAARELQQDYTSVEFGGVTYWIR